MNLSEFSVRRPVSIVMAYVAVFLLGAISWIKLPQELYPSITYPRLTVLTQYANAAPEEIESQVTKLIEEAISTVKNLRSMQSISQEGKSIVIAEFSWSADLDFSALYMREKLDQIKERLPRECAEPIVLKFNPFERPIMVLSLSSTLTTNDKSAKAQMRQQEIEETELLKVAKTFIKDRIEKIDGVATATISGGRERIIRVDVDQSKLLAHHINLLNVSDSIRDDNLNYPGGSVKEKFYEYIVRTIGEYKSVKEINDTVITVKDLEEEDLEDQRLTDPNARYNDQTLHRGLREQIVKLSDVATVKDTLKDKTSYSRFNGKNTLSIEIQKQADANIIKTCSNIREKLAEIESQIPSSMKLIVVSDQSKFIKQALRSVIDAGWQGCLLAFLVLLIFLKNLRTALVVMLSIPASIIVTLIPMYFMGLSVNMMSLMGLALAIGMLVDCSIVISENIFTKKEEGTPGPEAAIEGSQEMAGPVFSSTLTTVAVFFPTIFIIGLLGQLFKQLSFTIVFALLASLAVSMSLIPRFTKNDTESALSIWLNKSLCRLCAGFDRLIDAFSVVITQLLNTGLKHKTKYIGITFIALIVSMLLATSLDREIMPTVDEGQFMITLDLKPGTKVSVTNWMTEKIEALLIKDPVPKIHALLQDKGIDIDPGVIRSIIEGKTDLPWHAYTTHVVQALKEVLSTKSDAISDTIQGDLERILQQSRDSVVDSVIATVGSTEDEGTTIDSLGSHQAHILVVLNRKRPMSTSQYIEDLRRKIDALDLEVEDYDIIQLNQFAAALAPSNVLTVEIRGNDLNEMRKLVEKVERKLQYVKGIIDVKNTIPTPSPQTTVKPNKQKAAIHGLDVHKIALTANAAVKGIIPSKFKEEGKKYDILVRLKSDDIDSLRKIKNIAIFTSRKFMIPLYEVCDIKQSESPSEIYRQDQQRIYKVIATKKEGYSTTEVAHNIDEALKMLTIPSGYLVEQRGQSTETKESFKSLLFALILSISLVYMIMAAQFESLWQPFIIMFSVPFSIIGIVLILFLTRTSLSGPVFLGIILLAGMVVNNAIVLIDCINELREEGMLLTDAVHEACKKRLRPILMTTFTTILGLIPLALGLNEGGELQAPMARTIIGGLLVSTFLTLVILPVIFTAGEHFFAFFRR